MAIDGVFSHWITDDILAMARPNTGPVFEDPYDAFGAPEETLKSFRLIQTHHIF
jgi:hypothetical protein